VDRLTLNLINNRILQEADFYSHTSGGVYLLDEPRKRYFQEYERFVTRPQAAAAAETGLDFRRLFRRQAGRLRQTVLTGEPYAPFIYRGNP
jgi:CRISPR/Cas system-associated endonuclease Cas1